MLRARTRRLLRIYGYGVLGGLLLVYLALVAFLELGHDGVLRRTLMVGAICVSVAATIPPMRRLWLAAPLALVAIISLIVLPGEESPLQIAGQVFLWYLAACLFIDVLGRACPPIRSCWPRCACTSWRRSASPLSTAS